MTTTPEPPKVIAKSDTRRLIYDAAIAVGAIVVLYGLATTEEVTKWIDALVQLVPLVGLILARLNTPKGRRAK